MTTALDKATDRAEAIEQLREMFPPGSTATTILRHVSSSGMTRWISVVHNDRDVSWLAARALGKKTDGRHGGIKVGGCGMDMGFSLIYNLSSTLYRDGFTCTGQDFDAHCYCPSNDHSNGDRDYTPHHHNSGGYAVSQRWL